MDRFKKQADIIDIANNKSSDEIQKTHEIVSTALTFLMTNFMI